MIRFGLLVLASASLFALPKNCQVVSGHADLATQSLDTLKIHVDADRSILAWDQFSIEPHEQVHFVQKDSSHAVLNRVLGTEPSRLLGRLISNGQVLVINPNGILFGANAQIDVGSLVASTLDLQDRDFLEQGSWGFSADTPAQVENLGTIRSQGDVILLGGHVKNSGTIEAATLVIGAGGELFLSPAGQKRIVIRPDSEFGALVENTGTLKAERIEMTIDGNPYQLAFHHTGEIDALGIGEVGGEIILTIPTGDAVVQGGSMQASHKDGSGGRIHLLSQRIALIEETTLGANGSHGGGEILLGGDYQGKNPEIQNAEALYVDFETSVSADATEKGNGGRIILWSDGNTQFHGSLSAQGGPDGGDGGFIEVSGKESLDFDGDVNSSSPQGNPGLLLLDPVNVTISAAANANIAVGNLPAPPPVVANPYTVLFNGAPLTANINVTALVNALGVNDVIVNAGAAGGGVGNITLTAALAWATARSLTLTSTNDITLSGNITKTGTGALTLNAANNITVNNAISSTGVGGGVTFNATAGNITVSNTIAFGATGTGALTFTAGGNITVNNAISSTAAAWAGLTFNATGNVNLNSTIASAGSGNLSVTAGGTLGVAATSNITVTTVNGTGNIALSSGGNMNIFANVQQQNATVGNGGSGSVTLTSTNGNIQINQPASVRAVNVSARKGVTTVSAPRGDVLLNGGNANLAFTQIGERSFPAGINQIGDIAVTAGRDIILQGGTTTRTGVQIGHVGIDINSTPNVTSNITVTASRDLALNAGATVLAGGLAGAQIGHAAFFFAPSAFTMTGNTTVNIGRNGSMFIGPQSASVIGTLRLGVYSSVITIRCGGNFTTWTNLAGGPNSFALLGNAGGPAGSINSLRQTLRMYVAGNLCVDGRTSGCQFRPFNNRSDLVNYPAEVILHVGGNFNLIAGPVSDAAVVNQRDPIYREFFVGGNIRCYNGAPAGMTSSTNVGAALFYGFTAAPFGFPDVGEVNARANGDIIYAGRYGLLVPGLAVPTFFSTTGNLSMLADYAFAPGDLWTAQSVIVNGANIFAASALSSNSPAIPSNGMGAVALDANGYSFSQAAFPAGAGCISPPLFPVPALNTPYSVENNFRNITIISRNQFSDGTPADIRIGTSANTWDLQANAGNITVQGHQNSTVSGASLTATGSINHLVQNNMTLTGSNISAGQNVDLIVDNQMPAAPLIGPGAFSMNAASQISALAGTIRIYTARQSQNSIDPAAQFFSAGTPFTFTPGTLFADTTQEQWCTYYPSGNQGLPFTVFYKDCLQVIVEQAMVVVTEALFEFSFDLNWPYHGMNDYYGWPTRFYLVYQLAPRGPEHYHRAPEPYFMRRRADLLIPPRQNRLSAFQSDEFFPDWW